MGPSKPKASAAVASASTTPPTITNTQREQQDAIDELLKRRGRASTNTTGPRGAALQAPTSAAQLLGL